MDAGASVELICDGLHIHPAVIRLVHNLYGDRLNLISDSLRCAGMPDGDYELGGQSITVKNGKACLTGTDTLAGSSISMLDAGAERGAFRPAPGGRRCTPPPPPRRWLWVSKMWAPSPAARRRTCWFWTITSSSRPSM